jgi:hypothetical protein
MPKLRTGHGEVTVSRFQVARMAERVWRMNPERRRRYLEKARRRLDRGPARKADAAIVLAAGGSGEG